MNASITLNSGARLVFNNGFSLIKSSGGAINKASGAQIIKTNLWMVDSDVDGWPVSSAETAADGAPGGTYRRRFAMNPSSFTLATGLWSVDCNDGSTSVWQNISGYTDGDHDGYGAGTAQPVCSGSALPAPYVANNSDCYDSNANAYPGQTAYYTTNRGDGSFDYDCSGLGDRKPTAATAWNVAGAPAHGYMGSYVATGGDNQCHLGQYYLRDFPPKCGYLGESGGANIMQFNSINFGGQVYDDWYNNGATSSLACTDPIPGASGQIYAGWYGGDPTAFYQACR